MLHSTRIDKAVFNLIQTIRNLGYGEMFGVRIELTGDPTSEQLNNAEEMLAMIIEEGVQYIDVLTVHDGKPAMLETDFKMNGFHCRKKTKISA